MNCSSARDSFPELLDSRTAATAHLEARTHLAGCPDCQREFSALSQTLSALDTMSLPPPSPRLRQSFYAMLEEEKHAVAAAPASGGRFASSSARSAGRASLWRWVLAPVAVVALVAVGFQAGKRPVPSASAASAVAAPAGSDTTKQELALLREKVEQQNAQIEKMTTLVGWSILQQQQNPTNERLKEVLAAARADQPSERAINILLSALTLDPSANIRLSAIEALYRHVDRETVRAGVLAALPREQNPLVQLELIEFVAAAQDRNAVPALEKLSADDSVERTVRDAAQLALAQL